MIRGTFNSIIISGLLKSAAVARNVLCLAFNMQFSAAREEEGDDGEGDEGLSFDFNGAANENGGNDGGFCGTRERRESLIYALIARLRHVLRLIAQGLAVVTEALSLVDELGRLGVRVSGLVLDPVPACAMQVEALAA
jgi:hypothetical protein